jgi:TMEM175 potassium channel family protein
MSASERDPRLDRLFALTDGVYAIALTLLAVELVLPAASEHLHGEVLLRSILDSWPKILGFLTSFTVIAVFWHGNHQAFHYVRRFDGPLDWLMMLHLLCIAFVPFPTAIVGEHVSDPVALEFYYGTILVTGLETIGLWWYASSGPRLVDPGLHPWVIRRYHMTLLVGPVAFPIAMMALIDVGIGRLINPLLLGYLVMVGYVLLGASVGWEPRLEGHGGQGAPEDDASAKERRGEGSDPVRTDD